MRDTPTLGEVVSDALESRLGDLFVALPGRVESYDRTQQRAVIQPIMRRAHVDETGERVAAKMPVATDVPVIFPGSGGYSMTWALAAGDTGLLLFTSVSIDRWVATGASDIDPNDDRFGSLTDAIFIPGLRAFTSPVAGTHASALVIQSEGEIHAGGTAALALVSELNALRVAFNTHVHGGAGTVPTSLVSTPYAGTSTLKGS